MDLDQANALRWRPGLRNYYEVHYLTLNDLASQTGCWIRYTLHAPEESDRDPFAEVWFTFFDGRRPERSFGLFRKYPLAELQADPAPFRLRIGESELSNGRCLGRLDGGGHAATWDLHFPSLGSPMLPFPEELYTSGEVVGAMLYPHPSIRFSGRMVVDGRLLLLSDGRGEQSHIWGQQHPPHWLWCHCNHFEEDPTALLEMSCIPTKRNAASPDPAHVLIARAAGEEYRFISPLDDSTSHNAWAPGRWRLRAESATQRLEVTLRSRLEEISEAHYVDPNGASSYCLHTDLASAEVTLSTRHDQTSPWTQAATLVSKGTTHAEWGDWFEHPEIERKIVEIGGVG
jgi:hypothetical protein